MIPQQMQPLEKGSSNHSLHSTITVEDNDVAKQPQQQQSPDRRRRRVRFQEEQNQYFESSSSCSSSSSSTKGNNKKGPLSKMNVFRHASTRNLNPMANHNNSSMWHTGNELQQFKQSYYDELAKHQANATVSRPFKALVKNLYDLATREEDGNKVDTTLAAEAAVAQLLKQYYQATKGHNNALRSSSKVPCWMGMEYRISDSLNAKLLQFRTQAWDEVQDVQGECRAGFITEQELHDDIGRALRPISAVSARLALLVAQVHRQMV